MNVTEFDSIYKSTSALPYRERYAMLMKLSKSVDRDERGKPVEFSFHMADPNKVEVDEKTFQDTVSKAVNAEIDRAQRKYPMSRNPLGSSIIGTGGALADGIPSGVKRGQLKNFKGADAAQRAFHFGAWALACTGNAKAAGWCEDAGIVVAKAQHEGSNFSGGYLVPEILEQDIIDLRLEYGVFRGEANIVKMRSDLSNRARRRGGLTANFVGEGQAGTVSNKVWDSVALSAKKLMVLAIASTELSEDAVINVGDDLAGEIVYAFSLKEDQCGFLGDATATYGGIQGVLPKLITINGVDDGGGLVLASGNLMSEVTLADLNKLVARCPSYARRNGKWYVSPTFHDGTMWRLAMALGGITGQDVTEGTRPNYLGYPVVRTEVMPVNDANSQIVALFGDLRQAADFGDRRETTISFATSGTCDGVSLFDTDQVGIRGTERFDINNHDLGDATTAGPIVGLITAAS